MLIESSNKTLQLLKHLKYEVSVADSWGEIQFVKESPKY